MVSSGLLTDILSSDSESQGFPMVNYSTTVQQDRVKRKIEGESFFQWSGGKRLLCLLFLFIFFPG